LTHPESLIAQKLDGWLSTTYFTRCDRYRVLALDHAMAKPLVFYMIPGKARRESWYTNRSGGSGLTARRKDGLRRSRGLKRSKDS